jgi:hypothetical protein
VASELHNFSDTIVIPYRSVFVKIFSLDGTTIRNYKGIYRNYKRILKEVFNLFKTVC